MRLLALAPFARFTDPAALVVRVIVGIVMAAHGLQKLMGGPANFGQGLLGQLGVSAPALMGYVVTLVELGGGILLVIGLLSRLAALLLTINLLVAILLVKINVGLIAEMGAGAELDLALIAGFVTILLIGPGRLSVDQAIGIDGTERDRRGTPR